MKNCVIHQQQQLLKNVQNMLISNGVKKEILDNVRSDQIIVSNDDNNIRGAVYCII